MIKFTDCPTIASEAAYDEWKAAVLEELKRRNLNTEEAFDWYSFRSAHDEFGMSPKDAVEDYQIWVNDNG